MPKNKRLMIQLNERELASILAALRFHQDENLQGQKTIADAWIREVATDGGTLKPLDYDEVGKLCERITAPTSGLSIDPPPQESGSQPLYRVVYSIDIRAANPREAAKCTYDIMRDSDSWPAVLQVIDAGGRVITVDLSRKPKHQRR